MENLSKNQIIEIDITDIGVNGEGIGRAENGMAVFIRGALTGERVKAQVLAVKKNFAFAKPLEIIKLSSSRVIPRCPLFLKCGGCQIQHLSYDAQLDFKQNSVATTLKKIGGIEFDVERTTGSPNQYSYRNKIQIPVGNVKGESVIGFYRESSHDIIPANACPLHGAWADKLIAAAHEYLTVSGVDAYDEDTHKGVLRHIVAREMDGRLSVCFVVNANSLPCPDVAVKALSTRFENFALSYSVNKKDTNVILGDKIVQVYNKPALQFEFEGLNVSLDVNSFFQVNPSIAGQIYNQAVELSQADKSTVVIDAYSGIGVMSAMFAKKAAAVCGIEIVPQATKNAQALAENNHIDNLISVTADCETFVPQLLSALKMQINQPLTRPYSSNIDNFNLKNTSAINTTAMDTARKLYNIVRDSARLSIQDSTHLSDASVTYGSANDRQLLSEPCTEISNPDFRIKTVVVLDPPRKGCSAQLLNSLLENPVDSIIYVSCNPASLARDMSLLSPSYIPTAVRPFDMFPQTSHVETLICLTKKS